MAKKINKKTRNVISGVLVSAASIYAVINFADIPMNDVANFFISTTLFFIGILLLALIAVSIFKFFTWIKNLVLKEENSHDAFEDLREKNINETPPLADSEELSQAEPGEESNKE